MSIRNFDAILEFRGYQTTLAEIASFYNKQGLSPYRCGWTKSDLIRQVLEDFRALLIREELTKSIDNTEEAVEVLGDLGYGLATGGKRMQHGLSEAISKEAIGDILKHPIVDEDALQDAKEILEEE